MTRSLLTSSTPLSSALKPPPLRPLVAGDRAPLERILRATGVFSEEEVAVAMELIDEGVRRPDTCSYRFLVAEGSLSVLGYACFGAAPMTDAVHDLYWIAVAPEHQGSGVGRALLRAVEDAVRGAGGRLLLIETASKPSYDATRSFYERSGYAECGRIPDYYRDGDDKVIYGKRLTPLQP